MPFVSTIAQAAKLLLQVLDFDQDMEELVYLLSTKSDQVDELKENLRILAKRDQEDKETSLKLKEAKHKEETARTRKAHADLAETQITAHVEKELKALGATDALKRFRAKREQRRQEVRRIFRCDKDQEDGSRLARAMKRRQQFDEDVERDLEKKTNRSEELQKKWAQQLDNITKLKQENEIKAHQQKKIIAEEEEKARNNADTTEPAPKQGRLDKEKMPTFSCRQESDAWWSNYYWNELRNTEAHEEVDIPEFGSNEADYTEGRHYPPNWEEDRPEQFVEYVYPPPPPPPVAIEVIDLD